MPTLPVPQRLVETGDPVEKRLCRWLLMNHDRLPGDEIEPAPRRSSSPPDAPRALEELDQLIAQLDPGCDDPEGDDLYDVGFSMADAPEAIAREKAGIIKPRAPVVSGVSALGVEEMTSLPSFTGMVVPTIQRLEYIVDLKRVILRKLNLAIADGVMKADGETVYQITDMKVGLFEPEKA